MSLQKLKLDAFRGATKEVDISFDPTKKVSLIFGENGTGKSTIVDGLTFVCEQTIGSLEDRSGAQDEKFLVSVGRKKKELLVELECTSGTWKASFSGKNPTVTPPQGCPTLKVLRRARLMKLVEAEPKKKYDEIRSFIETPGIEHSEQALREAITEVSSKLDSLSREYTTAEEQLTELWNKDGNGVGGNALSWARDIKKRDFGSLELEVASIKTYEKHKNIFETATAILRTTITAGDNAQSLYDQTLAKQKAEESKLVGQSTDLLNLLKSAQAFVAQNLSITNCPVCQNAADGVTLAATLGSRIQNLTGLSSAVDATLEQKKTLDKAVTKIHDAFQELSIQIDSVVANISGGSLPLQFAVKIDNTLISQFKDTRRTDKDRLKAVEDICLIFATHYEAMKLHLEDSQKIITLKNAISIQLTHIDNNSCTRAELLSLQERLGKVLKIVEEERKGFVGEILVEISESVSALYEKIHPGESLSNIRLLLDPRFKGSLHIKGAFGEEKDIPPQAYFSESHLDTLGICIWLALTKKFAPKDAIVILDDVLTSVDSVHLDRFIDMVDAEAQHFSHVLMTTHYRPWRERYHMHRAQGSKIHFIELKEWHQDWGIITDSYQPAIQELELWLQPKKFDRQIVASKAGIFLEAVLDDFALRYSLQVPRKASQDYMLGELLDGLNKKKRKLLKVEHLDDAGHITQTIELEPIMDAIDSYAWVRNKIGCHYNAWGQDASDKDVREFAMKVVDLGRAIACPKGGDIPRHIKSGSYFESKSGQCRLYPLEMP